MSGSTIQEFISNWDYFCKNFESRIIFK